VKVLDIPRLDLGPGRIHVLVGPNGAGKTTLLRIVNGLERAEAGSVSVLGTALPAPTRAERIRLQRRMAFCPEKPYLFGTTVRRNVEYPLRVRGVGGVDGSERRSRAAAAMEKLGVAGLAERDARTLSAGETGRVAMARAIVADPELLLVDEPLANLDDRAVPLVEKVLVDLASRGATVVAATHVTDQAYRLSANVVRLEAGRLAPPAVENVLEGEIEGETEGDSAEEGQAAALVIDGGPRIRVATGKRGHARAAVDPHDIIVSAERFESSARNQLPARVTSLRERGGLVYVAGDVGVELIALITAESCAKLGLTVGSEVVFAFKATAVKVF
jgi:tungstate transport system ATP-binding protein